MKTKKTYLRQSDVSALNSCVRGHALASGVNPAIIDRVKATIDEAVIVADQQFPLQTVALGALVEVEYCDDGERAMCRLVLPDQVSANEVNISVLTPLGLALLGRSAQETIRWPLAVGRGVLEVKILSVEPAHSTNSELHLSHSHA